MAHSVTMEIPRNILATDSQLGPGDATLALIGSDIVISAKAQDLEVAEGEMCLAAIERIKEPTRMILRLSLEEIRQMQESWQAMGIIYRNVDISLMWSSSLSLTRSCLSK